MTNQTEKFVEEFTAFLAKSVADEIARAERLAKSQWKQINCKADAEGRGRAFGQLLVNIHDRRALWDDSVCRTTAQLGESLVARNLDRVGIYLERISQNYFLSAVDGNFRAARFDDFVSHLLRVIHYQYIAARLSPLHPLFRYLSDVSQNCTANHFVHCLFVAFGPWEHARWLGRYLMNFHRSKGTRFRDEDDNPEIRLMLRTLAQITETETWPADDSLSPDLGPYRALFATIAQPERFAEALMRVLDFRMARYNGFQDIGVGTRKMRWGGVLGAEEWAVLPVELFAFQALAERYLGARPNLSVEHPWITNPLSQQLKSIDMNWEDDALQQVIQLANETYGPAWLSTTLLPIVGEL